MNIHMNLNFHSKLFVVHLFMYLFTILCADGKCIFFLSNISLSVSRTITNLPVSCKSGANSLCVYIERCKGLDFMFHWKLNIHLGANWAEPRYNRCATSKLAAQPAISGTHIVKRSIRYINMIIPMECTCIKDIILKFLFTVMKILFQHRTLTLINFFMYWEWKQSY